MGWFINVKENTLKVPPDIAEKLMASGEQNDYYLGYNTKKQTLEFDSDAMEHMDCVWSDWFLDSLKDTDSSGDVVFMSAEGDNRGEIWGYRFNKGEMKTLSSKIEMIEDE